MVRRKNSTLLVCLVLLMSTVVLRPAWTAESVDSPEKIVNKPEGSVHTASKQLKPKPIVKVKPTASFPGCAYPFAYSETPEWNYESWHAYSLAPQVARTVFTSPQVGRWDVSVGVLLARLHGEIAWPRYPFWGWGGWWGGTTAADFTDGLQLPGHLAVPTWSVTYRFKPNWAMRYSGLAFQANGGGQPSGYFAFGPSQQYFGYYGYGTNIQSKYQHGYHRVGLIYDAVKNYRSTVRVFADWVHVDDRIEVISSISFQQSSVFSKGTDAAIAGIELQKTVKTTSNGATLSCECKAGGMFLDDVEGWDAQAGARYTIPLNQGRSGYVKGGYRLVAMKKAQNDFLIKQTLEGGYMEFGFIF